MPNPWLAIPLADYEGHMRSPAVDQLDPLAAWFGEVLARTRPASVAILGVAGGNGLDAIDPAVTGRVCGVDVNPAYLQTVAQRYARLPGLELHCADLSTQALCLAPVELLHAALIFEHAGAALCLENALALVAPAGYLSVVLQLPGPPGQDVSPSPYPSIQSVRDGFHLIDPDAFRRTVESRGLRLAFDRRLPLPGGKSFWMALFESPPSEPRT